MTVHFGNYEIDTFRFELRRAGRPIKLQRRPCELLLFLIENQGKLVARDEIAHRLWCDGVHVDAEHNINTLIRKIRLALRDDAEQQRYLQTVVGKGYIFVGNARFTTEIAEPVTAPDLESSGCSAVSLPKAAAEVFSPSDFDGGLQGQAESEPINEEPSPSASPNRQIRNQWPTWVFGLAACCCLLVAFQMWRHADDVRARAASAVWTGNTPIPSKTSEARGEFLRGQYLWNKRTLDGVQKAIACYRRAIALDPNYARAYAALGEATVILSSYGGPAPSETLQEARKSALRALALDSKLGEAHAVLAAVMVDLDWDWDGALREYRLAVTLDPNYATAHHWYALHLSRLGRSAEAQVEIEEALRLDPVSLIIMTDAAEISYRAGDEDRALRYLAKAGELDPNFPEMHIVHAEVDEQKKDFAGAIQESAIAENLFHQAPNATALRAHALALAGRRDEAFKIAHKLEELSKTRYVSGVDIGMVYCGLGDSQDAVRWFRTAYNHRDKGLNMLAADPLFANCHEDARFLQLLAELKLPTVSPAVALTGFTEHILTAGELIEMRQARGLRGLLLKRPYI